MLCNGPFKKMQGGEKKKKMTHSLLLLTIWWHSSSFKGPRSVPHVQSHNGTKHCCTHWTKPFVKELTFTLSLQWHYCKEIKAPGTEHLLCIPLTFPRPLSVLNLLPTVQKRMARDKQVMTDEEHHLISLSVTKTNSVNDISTIQFIKHNWYVGSLWQIVWCYQNHFHSAHLSPSSILSIWRVDW